MKKNINRIKVVLVEKNRTNKWLAANEYKSHVLGIANVGESPYLCTHNVLAKISTCLNNFQKEEPVVMTGFSVFYKIT